MTFKEKFPELNDVQIKMLKRDILEIIPKPIKVTEDDVNMFGETNQTIKMCNFFIEQTNEYIEKYFSE